MQEETLMKEKGVMENFTSLKDNNEKGNSKVRMIPTISAEVQSPGKRCRSADTNAMERNGDKQCTLTRRGKATDAKTCLTPEVTDIVAYFKEYCDAAGLHGVRYLSEDRRNYFEKIFWFITLVLCAVGCAFMIAKVKRKLDTSPVIVTFAESETNIWHLPFPAVTICPFVNFRQSDFNFTHFVEKFLSDEEELVDDFMSYLGKIESKIENSDRRFYWLNGSSTWIKGNFSERIYNYSFGGIISDELVILLEQMLLNNDSLSSRELIQNHCSTTSFSLDISPPEDNDLCKSVWEYYPIWVSEMKQKLMALGLVCNIRSSWWQRTFENDSFIFDDRAAKFLMKVTSLSTVYFYAEWNSEYISKDDFKEIWTSTGHCFTFNMINNSQIYNKNKSDKGVPSNYAETSTDWHPDTGYSAKAGPHTYPRRSSQYSSLYISLVEELGDVDELCYPGIRGYKVILHRPEDHPQPDLNHNVEIPINRHADISVNPVVMTTSPELKNYEARRRQCYYSDEKHLKYFRFYSKNNCLLECLTNATLNKCGCVAFHMPKNASTKICGIGLIDCVDNAAEEMEFRDMNKHLKDHSQDEGGTFNSAIAETECNCLPSCLSITYQADASMTKQNLSNFERILSKHKNDELLAEPVVSNIYIHYKNGYFIASRRSELYGQSDFLANCGGLLGLFSGFSLISLIEFIYFFTIRLWSNIFRRWNTRRKIHQNPISASP